MPKPEPFVRLLAQCDDTPTGKVAYAYVAMLDAGHTPIRIVSVGGALGIQPPAPKHQHLVGEPVVAPQGQMPEPAWQRAPQAITETAVRPRWTRWEKYLMTTVPSQYVNAVCFPSSRPGAAHQAWSMYRTVGVENILVVHEPPNALSESEALGYDAILCASRVVTDAWKEVCSRHNSDARSLMPAARVEWILAEQFHGELVAIGGIGISRGAC